jgi:DNA-directed RNA polymerase subunit E'/Rpb7
MFVLAELKETVKIEPRFFNTTLKDAVVEALNMKFANKV